MLELYHSEPVANSMKPLICLKEKDLEFTSHYVNLLRFEQHTPAFKRINPDGQVPVLIHDGHVVTESTVINEYLDDVFPSIGLRPADPLERANMRIWSKFVDEYFCPALSMIGWHVMVRRVVKNLDQEQLEEVLSQIPLQEQREKWRTVAGESFTPEQLADSRRRVGVSIGRMEAILRQRTWLAGATYSLADVNSYSIVAGVPRLCPEHLGAENTPATLNWLQRMNERPAVQAALAMPNLVPETLRVFGA